VPAASDIEAAVTKLRRDPNLGGQTKVRTLRWTKSGRAPASASPWLTGLFDLGGRFSGLALWAAGAVAAAIAAVWAYRTLLKLNPPRRPAASLTPSHVVDLDIRPASLPDDVGAAALELIREGRLRDALSLLYRASVSRAVHRFGVVIGASFTEREVLKAVRGALDESRALYIADLVLVRQRAVYAGEDVAAELVMPLCARFTSTLDGQAA
jgi:hypothetical protein